MCSIVYVAKAVRGIIKLVFIIQTYRVYLGFEVSVDDAMMVAVFDT